MISNHIIRCRTTKPTDTVSGVTSTVSGIHPCFSQIYEMSRRTYLEHFYLDDIIRVIPEPCPVCSLSGKIVDWKREGF